MASRQSINILARMKKYSIIIPAEVQPGPSSKELSAARILLEYFKKDIVFVSRKNNRTPDFLIGGLFWELKTPTGTGKYNLQHALRSAAGQSDNIVIDARFSKMHINRIKSELRFQLSKANKINRLLLIDKQKAVIEIK